MTGTHSNQLWTRKPLQRLFAIAVALSLFSVLPAPGVASDTATRWDRFSESSGCGEPFTRTPQVSKTGPLANSEAILGPFGTYFGRSIAEVRTHLRTWTVPFSGGMRVRVHEEALPSFQRVATGLEAAAAQGRVYHVKSASAFTSRSIGGKYRLSRHALGLAIDLNPAQNPQRFDGRLVTDMPGWFVEIWKEAGFCWGGDWVGQKDPMHFSWMGPGSTSWTTTDSLDPDPPDTEKKDFGVPAATHRTPFGPVSDRYLLDVADSNSNGTSDVIGVRSHPDGSVIDIALSTLGFGHCSISRWFIPNPSVSAADHVVFADFDGDSGSDLIALTESASKLVATTATRRERFADPSTSPTSAAADAVALTGADFDRDGLADLWEAGPDGTLRIWGGPEFTEMLDSSALPGDAPLDIAAGDRDGGDAPELFALYGEGQGSRIDVLGHTGSWSTEASFPVDISPSSIAAIGANDYDGDGRSDAQVVADDGTLVVFIGNTSTGIPANRWFINPVANCNDPILLEYTGAFMDDEDSTFAGNIESIAAVGVTRGCNPPFNDRFCPRDRVSREQMAAFLVRALGLTTDDHPGFTDVPTDSTFSGDIGKLATAGITLGCNPPANDKFCPKDRVSREQMAAFMVRALELEADEQGGFVDVSSGNTFVADIGKLATAGITKGCDPPDNHRFCPKDPVTRGQMAAFLDRAGMGE